MCLTLALDTGKEKRRKEKVVKNAMLALFVYAGEATHDNVVSQQTIFSGLHDGYGDCDSIEINNFICQDCCGPHN